MAEDQVTVDAFTDKPTETHLATCRMVVEDALLPIRSFTDLLLDLGTANLSIDPVACGDVMDVLLKSAHRRLFRMGKLVDDQLGGQAVVRASHGHATMDAGDVVAIVGGRNHA